MRSLISLSMLRGSSLLLLDTESEEVEKKSSSNDGSSLTSFRGKDNITLFSYDVNTKCMKLHKIILWHSHRTLLFLGGAVVDLVVDDVDLARVEVPLQGIVAGDCGEKTDTHCISTCICNLNLCSLFKRRLPQSRKRICHATGYQTARRVSRGLDRVRRRPHGPFVAE